MLRKLQFSSSRLILKLCRVKAYKEKFKEWKWQKNLPAEHAQWMVSKAHKRKREEAKETVFIYGGSKWTKERAESSASRSKKRMLDAELMRKSSRELKQDIF